MAVALQMHYFPVDLYPGRKYLQVSFKCYSGEDDIEGDIRGGNGSMMIEAVVSREISSTSGSSLTDGTSPFSIS